MKAIVQYKYGDTNTLYLKDVVKPKIKNNEILIEVYAANVSSGDMRINTLDVPFILKPLLRLVFGIKGPRRKVRGISGSGKVIEIGSEVTKYTIGDRVNYINSMGAGCLAEFVALKESSVMAKIADNVTYTDAAPISFGAMTAYHFMNESTIEKGSNVVIYGASGSVGSYALQLAKHFNASVTAVSSKKNHEAIKAIGADILIDYKTEDFSESKEKYDIVFDAVGKISKKQSMKILKENGKFLSVKSLTKELTSRMVILNELLSEGKIVTLMDKIYSLEEFKEAHKHVYGLHKVGNVVIEVKK
ncbi:MAG: NAD(P)-dependent alcohol dehydrogenase [Tenericutes bacterium]|nr:NAD(P)-dependent alcohol dehydrogenase [Mycoplasmatota bacterium]